MADKNPIQSLFEAPSDKLDYTLPPLDTERFQPVETEKSAASAPAAPRAAAPSKADLIRRAVELDIDPDLALSFFSTESSSNWNSKDSPKGARGGMQVMPGTFKMMMGDADQSDPWNNMEAGLKYIAYGQKKLGTRDKQLLAAGYHAGYDHPDLKKGVIPNTHDGLMSTRDYAKKVAGGAGNPAAGGIVKTSSPAERFVEVSDEDAAPFADPSARFVPVDEAELATLSAPQEEESTWDAVTRNAGHVADNVKIGWNNLLNSFDGMKANEYGALLQSFQNAYTPEQIAADPNLQAELKLRQEGYASAMGQVAARNKVNEALLAQARPETKQFFSASGKPAMEQLKIIGDAVASNPIGVISDLGMQSGPQSLAVIASALLARFSGGSTTTAAASAGLASATMEFGSDYASLREQGLSHDEAWSKATVKSGVVGAFDAVSMKSAGKAMDAILTKTADAGLKATAKSVAKKAGTVASQTGKQAGYGMAGEGLGSLASGRDPEVVDLAAEGLGEVFTMPAEALSMRGKTPNVPAEAVPPVAPAPQAPAKPSGPLTAAVEKAAEQPERVTVATPQGNMSGFMDAFQEDGQGNFAARVIADDGQIYNFTQADGVQITPEQQAAPLSNALEQAAEDVQAAPAPTEPVAAPAPAEQTAPVEAPVSQAKPKRTKKPAAEPVAAPAVMPEREKVEANLAEMDEPALRERLKYIANQAKASGGWNKMFLSERKRVEKEIAARKAAPKVEAQPDLLATEPTEFTDIADANAAMLKAAESTGQVHEVVERDGTFAIQPIKESTNDGSDTAGVRLRDERDEGAQGAASVAQDQPAGDAVGQEPPADVAPVSEKPASGAGTDLPGASAAADGQPALNPKREKALKRIGKGTAFFGTPEKAQTFIDEHGIGDSHEVKQSGAKRFDIVSKQAAAIDAAANEAATSPANDRPEPTQAQKEAGNYKKGTVSLHGMDIAIENPRGSTRSGTDRDGKAWEKTMSDHYGYVRRTMGADGDQVDVYVGPKPESDRVYVVDQIDQDSGKFDEHKAMLGYGSQEEAVAAYSKNFDRGWKVGPVKDMSVDEFKAWLKEGDTTKPAAKAETAAEGSFDSDAWNKERDDRIKASKEAGNTHLDQVPAYVETMRGKEIYSAHDPKERGVIRTVDNRGNVYVNWSDSYSAEKNLASPSKEGKKEVSQTTLGPTDLKDYVLADAKQQKPTKPAKGKQDGNDKRTERQPDVAEEVAGQQADQETAAAAETGEKVTAEDSYTANLYGTADKPLKFVSGMTRPGDFTKLFDANKPVGISLLELSKPSYPKIGEALANSDAYLFVDSGAYSVHTANRRAREEYEKNPNGSPPVDMALDFDEVMKRYEELELAVSHADDRGYSNDRVFFGMPDVVGNQAASLDLVKKYAAFINAPGVSRRIVPLQGGPLSLTAAYEQMMKNLGLDPDRDISPIVGIPSVVEGADNAEITALLTRHGGRIDGIHILGATAESRIKPRIEAIKAAGYDGAVSADATELRKVMVNGRPRSEAMDMLSQGGKPKSESATEPGKASPHKKDAYGEEFGKLTTRFKIDKSIPNAERLLIVACSDAKKPGTHKAAELYTGALFNVLNKWMPASRPGIAIISAKHGLIDGDREIENYDQRMSPERAQELKAQGADTAQFDGKQYREVLIAGGADYREVAQVYVEQLKQAGVLTPDATINATEGGIGELRGQLGDYLKAIADVKPAGISVADSGSKATPQNEKADQQPATADADGAATAEAGEVTKPKKLTGKQRQAAAEQRMRDLYGFGVGDIVTPSVAIDYLTAGKPMRVESISEREVYFRDPVRQSGTHVSFAMLQAAKFRGATFEVSPATPAAPGAEAEPKAASTKPKKPAEKKSDDASTKPSDKITDFGEKIGGAKKDTWTGFKDDLEAVPDDEIAAQPLSKVWPAPDYQKLIDEGMDAEVVATIRALRDEVPSKPRASWKVKSWAGKVKELRDMAAKLMSGRISAADVRKEGEKYNLLRGMPGRIDLYMEVGHAKSLEGIGLQHHHYTLYRGRENVRLWVVEQRAAATAFSNWPKEIAIGDTKEEAIAAFKAKYDSLNTDKSAKSPSFEIWSERGAKGFFVGKKIGRNYAKLAGPFETVKEARAYRNDNVAELEAKLEKVKEIPRERRDVNEPRVGEDMRGGQDVTPQMFGETFGFRGVEFGNWVEQGRRQKDLNDAFDALMDMAAILGIPPKAISLNGQLGLAFGARGSGGVNPAAAHYEPGKVVINLTKRNGAGSLGHEWWHALDNYFARLREQGGYLTEALDVSLSAKGSNFQDVDARVRRQMVNAFGDVVRSIRSTALKARSSKLDAKRTKEYWTTGREMSARAFESYLISKLQDQNASNDYLANIVDEQTWKAAESLGFELDDSYPYPTAGEIPVIRASFDKFFQTVETREEEGRTALYSVAALPEVVYIDGVARATVNAEGRPIAYIRPNVENFWRWYGDGATDAHGRPVVSNGYYVRPDGQRKALDNSGTFDANNGDARFSVAADTDPLAQIAAAADLFRLPASTAQTVEAIAADNDPSITVKKLTNIPGETRYQFTLPDGNTARMMVRPHNPYGASVYGFDLIDGEMHAIADGRPGKNADAVDGKDDVWIDVSLLSAGSGYGALIYNIAATYAHNTGKIFIGDPAGLSNDALARRPEMMLSSALKFGTTAHLAPHPRQIHGDMEHGVPGLDWVYGDDAGNIVKLMQVTLANLENNGGNGGIRYNKETNTFEDVDGNPLARADIDDLAGLGLGRAAKAGGNTLARSAVWSSLLQGEGKAGRDALQPARVLGAFRQLLRNADSAGVDHQLRSLLYSSRPVRDPRQASSEAIRRIMDAKGGEEVVSHPVLGDIALVYGDKGTGLQHIAARRGPDFLRRIPDLIAAGQVYTKDGQAGRVFLGNERDEAVIRLDWNGQDKAWLLSAYEKYPDLKAGTAQASVGAAPAAQRFDADDLYTELTTRRGMGDVIRHLVNYGVIELHNSTKTLPKGVGKGVKGIQAVTTPDGVVHLVANALTPANARPVLFHEMFHNGVEPLIGSEQWAKLQGRLGTLYRQSEQSTGKAREFFDRARERVGAAKAQGAVATRFEVEEFGAYAIEEYERDPQSLPAAIRKWVEDVIGLVKAWAVARWGKQLGQVTPAQLSALAKLAVLNMAVERRGELFGPIGEVFSVADPVNSPAFKRWFGKSVVTQNGKPGGKPRIVYRAMMGTELRPHPDTGMIHVALAREVAEDFATEGRRIQEVYVSAKIPFSFRNPDHLKWIVREMRKPKNVNLFNEQTRAIMGPDYSHEADADYIAAGLEEGLYGAYEVPVVFEMIRKHGYDGIFMREEVQPSQYEDNLAVFEVGQVKSARKNNGDFDPTNPDIRYSVSKETADQVLSDAEAALTAKAKDDFIGSVVGDMGLPAKLILHPRQVAAVHPKFTPVYQTGVSQIETRDEFVADLGTGMGAYDALTQPQKENVNKVLELGRLLSTTFSTEQLTSGVANTGSRRVVAFDDKGHPQTVEVPVQALLTAAGEVVNLSEAEIAAYHDLRAMFDRALDLMRDQTLDDMGFPELVGTKNAAKAIREMIEEGAPDAERLANIAKFIAEIEQAKRAGYVPFARYGDYVVTVKEKIADPKFLDDGADRMIVMNLPDAFAADMLELGAVPLTKAEIKKEGGPGWRITKDQKKAVEKLTEKTVYSAKVETGLSDLLAERKAGKVEDIPAVKAAIEQARSEWVGSDPNRRIVAFKSREKIAEQGVNLTDVSALAEIAQIDDATWKQVHEQLLDAQKAKGFRRHLIHADNVPGYSGDFERAMADYVIGMSGYLSRRQHMKRWDRSIDQIQDQPRLRKYAEEYRAYLNNPQEELAMVRQIGFLSYIAGVMMSAFANLTQVPLLTLPTLSQVAPTPLVIKELGRAYRDAMAMVTTKNGLDMFEPAKAPADVRAAVQEAWNEGAFIPLETLDLMMTARQKDAGRRKGVKLFNDATKLISLSFTFAERTNRLVTFIAAARLAEKEAVKKNARRVLKGNALARRELSDWTAKNFAEWVVDESQYRMGKANRPTIMRGVGSAIMQFKGFMLQTFEAWYRMAALHGKEGKFAMAASIAGMYAFAGLWGLPGADDLRELLEALYKQITGKDYDAKTELRAFTARVSGSNFIGTAVNKGLPYAAFGIDMTRIGMGSLVPNSPLAAAGIPFDLALGRPKRAFEKGAAGDYWGAAGELTPNFVKHPLQAVGWKTDGVRDKQGNRILRPEDLSAWDIALKSLGSQPAIVTDIRDYEYAQRRQETAVDALKRSYTAKLARAMAQMERTTDVAEIDALNEQIAGIYDDIAEHNAEATPEQQIQIGRIALKNRITREIGGVQATWGKERRQARGAADELRSVFGLEQQQEEE